MSCFINYNSWAIFPLNPLERLNSRDRKGIMLIVPKKTTTTTQVLPEYSSNALQTRSEGQK